MSTCQPTGFPSAHRSAPALVTSGAREAIATKKITGTIPSRRLVAG